MNWKKFVFFWDFILLVPCSLWWSRVQTLNPAAPWICSWFPGVSLLCCTLYIANWSASSLWGCLFTVFVLALLLLALSSPIGVVFSWSYYQYCNFSNLLPSTVFYFVFVSQEQRLLLQRFWWWRMTLLMVSYQLTELLVDQIERAS